MADHSDSMSANLMNVNQVAEYINLAPVTIRKMISARRIPFIKIGRRTVFRPEDIEEWLVGKTVRPVV